MSCEATLKERAKERVQKIVAAGIGGVLAAATFFTLANREKARFFTRMILDQIENAALYASLSPRFAAAFAWLQTVRFEEMEARHEIDGPLHAMRNEYTPRPLGDRLWEGHRAHADLQYMVEGEELIGYAPLSRATLATEYDPERDCAFYKADGDFFHFRTGQFAIFLPSDIHRPTVQSSESPTPVKKIVVKVPLF